MMKFIAIICLFLLLLGAAADLCAQEGTGGTRSVFSVGAGSRAIAMGGAFTPLGNDPSALYYNPAALRVNRFPGIMVNHIQLFSGFSDATYDFIGLAYPTLSAGSFGLGFMTVGTGSIREFDSSSRELGEISYREWQGMLSYAFNLPWKRFGTLSVGPSVKFLNQRVGDYSDTGTGLDVGFLYKPPYLSGVVLGVNLQDIIGAETKLVSVTEKVDRTLMFGAGYSHIFGNGYALNLAVQLDAPERDENDVRFGAEFTVKQMLSIRFGYDSEQITAGIGMAWRGYQVDYGYFNRDEAGSSHPITLSARIGTPLEEKIRVREERRLMEEERRIAEIFAARVAEHVGAAENYRAEGALEEALDELKIALEYDPTNEAVSETLAVVQRGILREQEERSKSAEKAILINQHFGLGLNYYSDNEYLLARSEWRNVLALDPENEGAKDYLTRTNSKIAEQVSQHRTKAIELERSGQLAAALGEWNVVSILDPESNEARAAAERISRDLDELRKNYRIASERLKVVELFDNALTAFSEGRYEETIELVNDVLKQRPDHEEARALRLRARRRLTPLTAEEKEEIKRLYIEGMKHFTQDKYTAAIEEWRKILEIDPDNESVVKNIEEAERRLKRVHSSEAD